jgi:hypothetical protein
MQNSSAFLQYGRPTSREINFFHVEPHFVWFIGDTDDGDYNDGAVATVMYLWCSPSSPRPVLFSSSCSQNSCRLRSVTWYCVWGGGGMLHPSHPVGAVSCLSSSPSTPFIFLSLLLGVLSLSCLPTVVWLTLFPVCSIFCVTLFWASVLVQNFHSSSDETNFINGRGRIKFWLGHVKRTDQFEGRT